jgi:hypothetical protein
VLVHVTLGDHPRAESLDFYHNAAKPRHHFAKTQMRNFSAYPLAISLRCISFVAAFIISLSYYENASTSSNLSCSDSHLHYAIDFDEMYSIDATT